MVVSDDTSSFFDNDFDEIKADSPDQDIAMKSISVSQGYFEANTLD
jgi:hypothetical protein